MTEPDDVNTLEGQLGYLALAVRMRLMGATRDEFHAVRAYIDLMSDLHAGELVPEEVLKEIDAEMREFASSYLWARHCETCSNPDCEGHGEKLH